MRLVFEIFNLIEENGEHTFRENMATDPEGIWDGRLNGMETIDKEIFQHLLLNTEEEAKMVVTAVESVERFVAHPRLHAKYFRRTFGENHADPQGVYVPESGKGREVAHFGHFPVGGLMECHAQGDERPERAGALENGGVLGIVTE